MDLIKCPCFYFDLDPDATEEGAEPMCICSHVLDEHDEDGECQAEIAA